MIPLQWNYIYHLHAQTNVYSDINEKIKAQQSDHKGAVTFRGLKKLMPRRLCALTAWLGIWIFLKIRVPLHLQVRGQAKEMQGFCALDLCLKSHLFCSMTSRIFKWTCWTCSLGRGKCFTQFSVKVTLWQILMCDLFPVGKRTLFVGSSDWGCHQCALGLERILLVGAFSSLYCYCERAVNIISWNVYSLERVAGRALERYPNLIWTPRPYGDRHLQQAKKSGTGFSSHI